MIWHCSARTGTLLLVAKNGAPVLANFSKTADQTETRHISKQSLAQAGSNKKKSLKSVHSTTSYSKIKVPYQITKKAEYSGCRAKIEHLNLRKRYIKYTYSESMLDGLFKTLILLPEVTKFKASKLVPGGVNRFWG